MDIEVNHENIGSKITSHPESASALQGTQNASVAYRCTPNCRQEATLRRDRFLF